MARKRFLFRLDPRLYAVLEKWAADDFRSVNAQMEFLLQEAARRAGRWRLEAGPAREEADAGDPDGNGKPDGSDTES